jgi:5'-nucleotidase
MKHHLGEVHKDMHQSHCLKERPQQPRLTAETLSRSPSRSRSSSPGQPLSTGTMKRQKTIVEGQVIDSDSEDEILDIVPGLAQSSKKERDLIIMRRVTKKWRRLAGLSGQPDVEDVQSGEFVVGWSRGIAPRLEGRIKIVGS